MKTIETRVYFWSVSLCWSLKRSILMLKFERKPEAQIKKNHMRYGALSSAKLDLPEGVHVGSV